MRIPEARRRSWRRALERLEREVADPENRTPIVEYFRALRSMSAECSLGRVSATVKGFSILQRVRIAPEMALDPGRLGRLVRRARTCSFGG